MKKLLLSLALILGITSVASAVDVTLPADGKTWSSYTWTKNGDNFNGVVENYTLLLDKGTSTSDLVSPDQYSIRIYGGAKLTITAPEGVTFDKVVVNYDTKYTKATSATASEGWTCSTFADGAFTVTTTSAKSTLSIDGDGKQLRVASLVITASGEGNTPVDPVDPPVVETTEVANIAAFLELAKDTKVKFTSPVTVVWQHQNSLYIKDATGTALVYGKLEQTYASGTVITGIAGTVGEYNGVKQLAPDAASFTEGTPGTAVEPEILQVEEIAADNVNAYVKLIGVTIAEDNGRNFKMSDASGEIALYQNWTDIQIPTGENMTVTGFIGLYKGNAQVLAATVTSASGKEVVATPKFSVAEGEVAEGTEVAITSATEGATIYYTVDGTNPTAASAVYTTPVVINEALTIKAIAVKDGMDDSAVATAAYTIKAPVVVAGNQAMFNFAEPTTLEPAYKPEGTEQSYLVAEVPGVTFTNNGISVVSTDGSSTARLWKCGTNGHGVEYRVYAGATTTISAQEGLLIKSVEFTGAQLTTLCYNSTALEGATSTSWTSEEGVKSVEFKCVTNGSYKRADIATIKVTFEKASDSIADVELDENAPAEYYNLQGVRMNGELTPGLYIRRQGNKTAKVIVK